MKLLISATAVAVTVGGWAAFATAEAGGPLLRQAAPASAGTSLALPAPRAVDGVNGLPPARLSAGEAPAATPRPPRPVTRTRSSR